MYDNNILNNSVIGFGFIINIFAEHKFIDNYLQVQNCIFRNNVANSVQIDSVSDVVIQSSIFENNTEQVGKGGTFIIANGLKFRMADTLVSSSKRIYLMYLWHTDERSPLLDFLTLNSNVSAGDIFLQSSTPNFLLNAVRKNIINVTPMGTTIQSETLFASGKYRLHSLCILIFVFREYVAQPTISQN